jgi:hypothetical protein
MSESKKHKIRCPACQHEQEFTLWEAIDATQDPGLKEQLLAGQLNRMTCSQCQEETDIIAPMLYHDSETRLMIWLLPGVQTPTGDDDGLGSQESGMDLIYHFRLVRTLNALKEKVVVAEAGLDDRALELFKVLMRRDPNSQLQAGDTLLFAGLGEEESEPVAYFAVLRGKEQFMFSMPFDVLSRFADEAESQAETLFKSVERWLQVDQETIERQLAEVEREEQPS